VLKTRLTRVTHHTRATSKAGEAMMPKKRKFWVLFDMSNAATRSHNRHYLWWFDTKKQAKKHLKQQRDNPNFARLSDPVCVRAGRGYHKIDNDQAVYGKM